MRKSSNNPYSERRKAQKAQFFDNWLGTTVAKKFEHKRFADRFKQVNIGFIILALIAQIASFFTAWIMLSYLFEDMNIIIRFVLSTAVVVFIEKVKRDTVEDVLKSAFQYGEGEWFPVVLGCIAIAVSLFISVEGAKILPQHLLPYPELATTTNLTNETAIKSDYNKAIAAIAKERDQYRADRKWQGRLASKDAAEIKKFNSRLAKLEAEKKAALQAAAQENKQLLEAAQNAHISSSIEIDQKREYLGRLLVYVAAGLELLFLFSLTFSWWYYSECAKEMEPSGGTPKNNKKGTPKKGQQQQQTTEGTPQGDRKEDDAQPRAKATFKDYEKEVPKKEPAKSYPKGTCIECGTTFDMVVSTKKYCSAKCKRTADKKRERSRAKSESKTT